MQLASLFATPISMFENVDMALLGKEITDILVTESVTIPSLAKSNVGGWHSKYELQTRPEACFQKLSEYIANCAREMTETIAKNTGRRVAPFTTKVEMWAMVMRDGDYTVPHTHADTQWASVFYADAGDSDDKAHPESGNIMFIDPRMGFMPITGLDIAAGEFVVKAKTGQLLIFPGWLMHYVHVYRGKRPRVSISCNVRFQFGNK
ncbi:MAG: hypothetical protein RL761_765 [Pseudomonadota bacterium]